MVPAGTIDQVVKAIADKPVLEALCNDIREAANALPAGVERRLVLMEVLVALSKFLRSPGYRDISPAVADGFRNDHGIPIA